jgi:hypothetical protein
MERDYESIVPHRSLETLEVSVDGRRDVRVEHSRRCSLVLAPFTHDAVGE